MMSHTPEPWRVGGAKVDWSAERDDWDDDVPSVASTSTQSISADGRDEPIALVVQPDYDSYRSGDEELTANTKRIVDCVNAMAGIDDPALFIADFNEMKKHLRNAVAAVDKQGKLEGKGPSVWFMGFETEEARALLSRMGDA